MQPDQLLSFYCTDLILFLESRKWLLHDSYYLKVADMVFHSNPFKQAEVEVADKSMGTQILHSSIFHSIRSATASGGSAKSKIAGAALGVGKLFLALIPVPIVGAVVGAAVDGINGAVRSAKHKSHINDKVSHEEYVKFAIKELTVENLDRYRWKVAQAFEGLNAAITTYNGSKQSCDDMYALALVTEQIERRKKRLKGELKQFQEVISRVDLWVAQLDSRQGAMLDTIKNDVMAKTRKEIQTLVNASTTEDMKAKVKADHTGCEKWCYIKRQAKYNPNDNWTSFKQRAGEVSSALLPIAISAVAVRQSDYTSDSNNSSFTVSSN